MSLAVANDRVARHAAAPTSVTSSAKVPRLSQWGVIRSEWTKLWSLRSTYWALAVAFVISVGFSLLPLHQMAADPEFQEMMTTSQDNGNPPLPIELFLVFGLALGTIAVMVLATLNISGEYSTGQVRSTFVVVPRRWQVLAAKALVMGAVSFLLGVSVVLVTWFVGKFIFGNELHPLTDALTWGTVLGAGLYLAIVALMALGLGFAIRSTAATIAGMIALFYVAPTLITLLATKFKWLETVQTYLIGNLSDQIMLPFAKVSDVSTGAAIAGGLIWAVAFIALGLTVLLRRDV